LDRSIGELRKLQNLAKIRLSTGVGNQADLLQIQGRLAQEEQLRPDIVARLRAASTQLALVLGRSVSPLYYASAGVLTVLQLPAWRSNPQDLLTQALRRHPQILREQANIQALQEQRKALVWGTWLPSVHLQVQGGALAAGILNAPFETGPQYSLRFGLQWSFDVSIEGRNREIHHRQTATSHNLRQIRLHLQNQIALAYARTRLAISRLHFARRFAQIAHQSLLLQQARYQSGVGNVLGVIEAQRTLVQARQQLLDTTISNNRAQIVLQGLRGQLQPNDFAP
jgi:outer membrane protein TolC